MLAPDHYALLINVSAAMHSRVKRWIPSRNKHRTLLNELDCFLDPRPPKTRGSLPAVGDFRAFVTFLYRGAQLEPEGLILGLAYYERILAAFDGVLMCCRRTWRPLVLISLIMASKMYDDLSMINADFVTVCQHQFSLENINRMELAVVLLLRFNLNVSMSNYAQYYFKLRAILGVDLIHVAQRPFGIVDALRHGNVPGSYEAVKDEEYLQRSRTRRTQTFAMEEDIFPREQPTLNLEKVVMSWHSSQPKFSDDVASKSLR